VVQVVVLQMIFQMPTLEQVLVAEVVGVHLVVMEMQALVVPEVKQLYLTVIV
jgi:hypothetical protein